MIRAIEATAAAEERGVFRKFANRHHRRQHLAGDDVGGHVEGELCCEKHALRIEMSAVRMVEERLKDTSDKVFSLLIMYCKVRTAEYANNLSNCITVM